MEAVMEQQEKAMLTENTWKKKAKVGCERFPSE
jgi:hypothetical protein